MPSAPRVIPDSSNGWIMRSIGSLSLKNSSRVIHQHSVDLLVGDPFLLQSRDHVVVDVQVVPAGQDLGERPLRQPMVVAGGIMGENHLAGMAALKHLDHGVNTIFEGEDGVDP